MAARIGLMWVLSIMGGGRSTHDLRDLGPRRRWGHGTPVSITLPMKLAKGLQWAAMPSRSLAGWQTIMGCNNLGS